MALEVWIARASTNVEMTRIGYSIHHRARSNEFRFSPLLDLKRVLTGTLRKLIFVFVFFFSYFCVGYIVLLIFNFMIQF